MVHAELHLHERSGRREGVVWRGGGNDDEVDVIGGKPSIVEGGAGSGNGEVGGELALGRDMALLDTDALLNPLVGRIDRLGQFLVGQDFLGQVAADPTHNGTNSGHADLASESEDGSEAAILTGKRRMLSPIFSIRLLRAIS